MPTCDRATKTPTAITVPPTMDTSTSLNNWDIPPGLLSRARWARRRERRLNSRARNRTPTNTSTLSSMVGPRSSSHSPTAEVTSSKTTAKTSASTISRDTAFCSSMRIRFSLVASRPTRSIWATVRFSLATVAANNCSTRTCACNRSASPGDSFSCPCNELRWAFNSCSVPSRSLA